MPLNPPTSSTASAFMDGLYPMATQDPWQSGRYYLVTGLIGAPSTGNSLGTGTVRAQSFVVPNAVTLTRIGAEVTNIGDVGSKVRLGIFNDDGHGRPGTVAVDAGVIAGDSATVQELVISTALQPGNYWACGCVQVVTVTQPTLRIGGQAYAYNVDVGTVAPVLSGNFTGRLMTGVAGAFSTWVDGGSSGSGPRMFVKVS